MDGQTRITALGEGRYRVEEGSRTRIAYAIAAGRDTWVFLDGRTFVLTAAAARARTSAGRDADALAAPMPATVVKIDVAPGQAVTRDSLLIMLEAMKMEVPIKAPRDGRVTAVHCRVGEIVQPGVPLLDLG